MIPATNAIGAHARYSAAKEEWVDIHSVSAPGVRSLAADSWKCSIFSVCVQQQEESVAATNSSQVALPIASIPPHSARHPASFHEGLSLSMWAEASFI